MEGTPSAPRRSSRGLVAYVAVLTVLAVAAGVAVTRYEMSPPGRTYWAALPALAVLIAIAEVLVVRVRYGDEIDGVNLVEAALAPLLFAFPGGAVVATVAVAMLGTGLGRRLSPLKVWFNVAQWSLAAAAGAAVVERVARVEGINTDTVPAVIGGLVAVWLVNNAAFTLVVAFAERKGPGRTVRDLLPVILPGWVGGWFVNALLGMLYVLAYASHPLAVVLFPVPLLLLHLAYRGYATARADRLRLAVLHRAAQVLSERLDPREAIPDFLREVARGFEASGVLLVLNAEGGVRHVHALRGASYDLYTEPADAVSIAAALSAHPGPVRVTAAGREPLASAVAAAGWRDCLAAPLSDDGRSIGALVVLDQAGVVSGTELTVLETLARETAGALGKGRLVARVLEERRRLDEIVTTTSDGIATLTQDGVVRSWNPAMERITGIPAVEMVGRPGALAALEARTASGEPVELTLWPSRVLPNELCVRGADGRGRRLSCSYSRRGDEEDGVLVVIARDVTAVDEIERLREEFSRLAEVEEAQRLVVEQLQQAVMPSRPEVEGLELGVSYLASETHAPTGGDLYDWQVLPDGTMHIAVVDVLGHGVAATKDALAVVHTLRTVAVAGEPLESTIGRADELLCAQHPDLVATVVVARYDPRTGHLRVAAGGHPPALVVSPRGEVTQLSAAGGAIGWPGAGSDIVAETTLDVRDALVLYTDGLVEAGKDILAGMEALVGHARDVAHLPSDELANELVSRALHGAARIDDTLALVVRRLPVAAAETTRTWTLAPEATEVSRARRAVRVWLEDAGVVNDDALIVISELLANAVRAARDGVSLTVSLTGESVEVEVSDDGPGVVGIADLGNALPPDEQDSGRGLFIVKALASDVTAMSTAEGSYVRAAVPRVDARAYSDT